MSGLAKSVSPVPPRLSLPSFSGCWACLHLRRRSFLGESYERSTCFSLLLIVISGLSGCRDQQVATPPNPFALTAEAVGHYCGMNFTEHAGPKGQIILASQDWPVWFSSAREALSFTMLAEEAKDIRAIYVSDMAKARAGTSPGPITGWRRATPSSSSVVASRAAWARRRRSRSQAAGGGTLHGGQRRQRRHLCAGAARLCFGSGTQPDGSAQKLNSGGAASK